MVRLEALPGSCVKQRCGAFNRSKAMTELGRHVQGSFRLTVVPGLRNGLLPYGTE